MKPLFFGECDRLDDGGFVIGEFKGTRLQLGDEVIAVGFWLRYVRGLLHSSGRRFGIGSHQDTDVVWLVRDDGRKVPLGKRAGAGVCLHEVTDGIEVAYMPTVRAWRAVTFTLDLQKVSERSDAAVLTSQGLIDFDANGKPIVAGDPLDRPIGGTRHKVRWLVARGNTQFGKTAGGQLMPDGLLMARAGKAGTMAHGRVFEVFNISTNGRYWVGQHLASETVFYGDVPETVPPLVTTSPPPPQNEDDAMTDAQWKELKETLKRLENKVDSLAAIVKAQDQDEGDTDDLPDLPPPPEPEPRIDPETVEWLGRVSPLDFPATSEIREVTIRRKPDDEDSRATGDNFEVCFPHTKAGRWPEFTNSQGKKYEGNVCVFARIKGRWYGDTAEWLKAGQTCKRFSNRTEPDSWGMGPHTKHAPMESWGPVSGEWFGVMVCTPVREGVEGNQHERSNIFMARWP